LIVTIKSCQVIIDECDYDLIKSRGWCVSRADKQLYVKAKGKKGEPSSLLLHRLIMNAGHGQIVDHIDRNGLNNSRSNLRFCTHSQNHLNADISKANTSGFQGVTLYKRTGRWVAQVHVKGKHIHLGYFDDPKKAEDAYLIARRAILGKKK
jgi:hypothetical protein